MNSIWPPLVLSLKIALAATLLTMAVGIPLAYFISRRRFRGKSLLEGIIMMPLVLPPTVVGYFIIILLGARGFAGRWLVDWFDYSIMFRVEGAVLAAAIVALPMLYLPARGAFASIDRELEDMAHTLGANRLQMFWHVNIPLARRGLTSGIMLAFARALGEFGATVMVLGIRPQEEMVTLPISVYLDFEQGAFAHAAGAVIVLSTISLTLTMLYNMSSLSRPD